MPQRAPKMPIFGVSKQSPSNAPVSNAQPSSRSRPHLQPCQSQNPPARPLIKIGWHPLEKPNLCSRVHKLGGAKPDEYRLSQGPDVGGHFVRSITGSAYDWLAGNNSCNCSGQSSTMPVYGLPSRTVFQAISRPHPARLLRKRQTQPGRHSELSRVLRDTGQPREQRQLPAFPRSCPDQGDEHSVNSSTRALPNNALAPH